jgi:hypothetical protein
MPVSALLSLSPALPTHTLPLRERERESVCVSVCAKGRLVRPHLWSFQRFELNRVMSASAAHEYTLRVGCQSEQCLGGGFVTASSFKALGCLQYISPMDPGTNALEVSLPLALAMCPCMWFYACVLYERPAAISRI